MRGVVKTYYVFGIPVARRVDKGLTLRQLQEWEAIDRLDPIGRWRQEFGMAQLASVVTNLALSIHGEKGAKMTSSIDFMPDWSGDRKEETPQQSAEEMKKIFMEIAGAQNKKVKREKEDLNRKPTNKRS